MHIFAHTATVALASVALLLPGVAFAEEPADAAIHDLMAGYVQDNALAILSHDAVIAAIEASNAASAGLSEAAIETADQAWRVESEQGGAGLYDAVRGTDASEALADFAHESRGEIIQIMIMDNIGMLVATNQLTGDLYQGDELKFSETYPNGADAVFVAAPEFDEELQIFTAVTSVTVTHPETGEPIGAASFFLNADLLLQ